MIGGARRGFGEKNWTSKLGTCPATTPGVDWGAAWLCGFGAAGRLKCVRDTVVIPVARGRDRGGTQAMAKDPGEMHGRSRATTSGPKKALSAKIVFQVRMLMKVVAVSCGNDLLRPWDNGLFRL